MITFLDTDVYTIRVEILEDAAFLHFNYKLEVFSKSIYHYLLEQWTVILQKLKELGMSSVRSIIPDDWKKAQKWQTMFGLAPYAQGEGLTFYAMEI